MAELHVSKKSIGKLFSEMQNKKFIIPDFQRPYKWEVEKCETLWNDIENFTQTDAKEGSDYFLGTIVSYINKDKNQEIIDGQQRLTSFFLLLRAFFNKLESMDDNDADVKGLKNQLAPCIWDTNSISQVVSDRSRIHIESLVATEEDNETFHNILETGNAADTANDNYSKNYLFFRKKCNDYAASNPMQWKELCVSILQKCIILPIECDTPETALTIFSTLNDRGLPLADSDIFKAQIYRSKNTVEERRVFTDSWKELSQICIQGNLTIDEIFRYYSHVLRTRNNDKSKEVGLRKFYGENNYEKLREENLMTEIFELANFWRYINESVEPDNEVNYVISITSRKFLQCLDWYPNDFWKYATSVFFIKNINSDSFERDFESFLRQLVAFLFVKFINQPTVNAIKDDIYSICISLIKENKLQYKSNLNLDMIEKNLDNHHSSRISRALLLLHAYLNSHQYDLIPKQFDIEHIFPKKWQEANYNGWDKEDAKEYLDHLGNKIILEKKINIQAGNGYFDVKREKYKNSKISTIADLVNHPNKDWLKKDIEQREARLKDELISFFSDQLVTNN